MTINSRNHDSGGTLSVRVCGVLARNAAPPGPNSAEPKSEPSRGRATWPGEKRAANWLPVSSGQWPVATANCQLPSCCKACAKEFRQRFSECLQCTKCAKKNINKKSPKNENKNTRDQSSLAPQKNRRYAAGVSGFWRSWLAGLRAGLHLEIAKKLY